MYVLNSKSPALSSARKPILNTWRKSLFSRPIGQDPVVLGPSRPWMQKNACDNTTSAEELASASIDLVSGQASIGNGFDIPIVSAIS